MDRYSSENDLAVGSGPMEEFELRLSKRHLTFALPMGGRLYDSQPFHVNSLSVFIKSQINVQRSTPSQYTSNFHV